MVQVGFGVLFGVLLFANIPLGGYINDAPGWVQAIYGISMFGFFIGYIAIVLWVKGKIEEAKQQPLKQRPESRGPLAEDTRDAETLALLDGLDEVDWGPDFYFIPELLNARASTDPDIALSEQAELSHQLCHQGSIYDETLLAIPFLVKLILRPETVAREDLVYLLAYIIEGTFQSDVYPDRIEAEPEVDEDEDDSGWREADLQLRREARTAVAAHLDEYWRLFDTGDVALRQVFPYLFCMLVAAHERVRREFPAQIASEEDDLTRASMLFCLAHACHGRPECAEPLLDYLDDESHMVRLAASHVAVLGGSESRLDEALDVFVDPLRNHDRYYWDYRETFTWGDGEPEWHAQEIIDLLVDPALSRLFARIDEILPTLSPYCAKSLASDLLHLGFDRDSLPTRREDLSESQTVLLRAIARDDTAGVMHAQLRAILESLGVRDDKAALRRFLGIESRWLIGRMYQSLFGRGGGS